MAACVDVFLPSLARARRSSSFSLPPRRQRPGTRQSSRTTSAVCEARMPIFLNFWPWEMPGVPSGTTKLAWPAAPERRVDREHEDVGVGDAAIGDPGLRAVEHPLVLGLVVDGARLQGGDVRAGIGLGDPERRQLDVVGRPEALGDPLADLLGRPVGEDPGHGQGRAEDGQRDAGVTPAHLLVDEAHEQTGRVREALRDEVEGVEPVLGRLLNDRPRRLLPLVPFGAGGTDDVLGELVHPLDDLELVLVELEGVVGHGCALLARPRPRPRPLRSWNRTWKRSPRPARRTRGFPCYSTVTYDPAAIQPPLENGSLNWGFCRISGGWRCRSGVLDGPAPGDQLVPQRVGPGEVLGAAGLVALGHEPRRLLVDLGSPPLAATARARRRARGRAGARRCALASSPASAAEWAAVTSSKMPASAPGVSRSSSMWAWKAASASGSIARRRRRRLRPRTPRPSAPAGRRHRSGGPARPAGPAPSRRRPASRASPRSGER